MVTVAPFPVPIAADRSIPASAKRFSDHLLKLLRFPVAGLFHISLRSLPARRLRTLRPQPPFIAGMSSVFLRE